MAPQNIYLYNLRYLVRVCQVSMSGHHSWEEHSGLLNLPFDALVPPFEKLYRTLVFCCCLVRRKRAEVQSANWPDFSFLITFFRCPSALYSHLVRRQTASR